ncbi:hypothetical protein ANCDUO_27020 [Ancylostoma duodenale]|uniref:Solute carrier family 40 member n=1 Tax=Ancylostoma duodenale TaxID=51022 RepID=A0A0C2BGW1_9BILA|nr:hypothetical protein ANCDUO_27020 [Ancylostoma duodenale]
MGGLNATDPTPALPFSELSPSIIVFFLGITLARFGLWIADPSITQIMQETIPERERYSVFGVQTSICELFSVLKDLMALSSYTGCEYREYQEYGGSTDEYAPAWVIEPPFMVMLGNQTVIHNNTIIHYEGPL